MKCKNQNKSLYAIVMLVFSILLGSCGYKTSKQTYNTKNHKGLLIEVNDSTVVINKKNILHMSDSLSQWIAVLGTYDRKFSGNKSWDNTYIWDSIGIIVNTYHEENPLYGNRADLVSQLNIHLQGLNSETGRSGKLKGARRYDFTLFKDSLELINHELKKYEYALHYKQKTKEEVIQNANERWAYIKKKRRPEEYAYPYKSFLGPLYLNGVPIYSNEQLKSLNDRRKAHNLDLFSYIDYYSGSPIYGKKSTGETEKMYDAYYYVAHSVNKPKQSKALRYQLRTVYPYISHIKIEFNQEILGSRFR